MNIDQQYFKRQFPTQPYSFIAKCRVTANNAPNQETINQVLVGIISNGGTPNWCPLILNQQTGLWETSAAIANDNATPFTAQFKANYSKDWINDPIAEST